MFRKLSLKYLELSSININFKQDTIIKINNNKSKEIFVLY